MRTCRAAFNLIGAWTKVSWVRIAGAGTDGDTLSGDAVIIARAPVRCTALNGFVPWAVVFLRVKDAVRATLCVHVNALPMASI